MVLRELVKNKLLQEAINRETKTYTSTNLYLQQITNMDS